MKLEVRNHEVRSSNELPGLPYNTTSIFPQIMKLGVGSHEDMKLGVGSHEVRNKKSEVMKLEVRSHEVRSRKS